MRNKNISGRPPNISRHNGISGGGMLLIVWGVVGLLAIVVVFLPYLQNQYNENQYVEERILDKHPCCLCPCGIQDYPHDCMKLCVLPKDEIGDERMMEELEQTMCAHLCAFKHEGKKHNEH